MDQINPPQRGRTEKGLLTSLLLGAKALLWLLVAPRISLFSVRFGVCVKCKHNLLIRSQQGQIVIEYILLLIMSVTIAAILVRGIASRSEENAGFMVKKWLGIEKEIGADIPEKCVGTTCNP